MEQPKVSLILGCLGRCEDDFVECSGIENIILTPAAHSVSHTEIMDYLDRYQLFDRPIFDYNSVRHLIFNLQNQFSGAISNLWSEQKFQTLQRFTLEHKKCGLYLKLTLKPVQEISAKETRIKISAHNINT